MVVAPSTAAGPGARGVEALLLAVGLTVLGVTLPVAAGAAVVAALVRHWLPAGIGLAVARRVAR